jgi:phospholipase C
VYSRWISAVLAFACLAACDGAPGASGFPGAFSPGAARRAATSTPIKHVVIIMQENRSFENLFHAFPGARTVNSGVGHDGTVYHLQSIPLTWPVEMDHSHYQFLEDYDKGKIDGFDQYVVSLKKTGSICSNPINRYNEPPCFHIQQSARFKQMSFSYVDPTQITEYWAMAQQYALGDNTFSSNNGPTFPSHQYLIAGESGHATEVPHGQPWGCDAETGTTVNVLKGGRARPPVYSEDTGHEIAGPYPCFTYPTIAQNLDASNVTWKYYAQETGTGRDLDPFESSSAVWNGPDRKNIIYPDTQVLKDIRTGKLANVSWVTPSGQTSDHPGPQSGNEGPKWVASIVNAIGKSEYWKSTAIIVMWDEWGGWYDEVKPPQYLDSQSNAYEGLGFRVPLIVVSPYARAGYISHKQHEIAGTLRFLEETFDLPFIGGDSGIKYADQRADGFDDMFDYTQKPIPFVPIRTTGNATLFENFHDDTPADTY